MTHLPSGLYLIESVGYRSQVITVYERSRGLPQSSAVVCRDRGIHVALLFSRWRQKCRRSKAARTPLELLVTQLGFTINLSFCSGLSIAMARALSPSRTSRLSSSLLQTITQPMFLTNVPYGTLPSWSSENRVATSSPTQPLSWIFINRLDHQDPTSR